MGMSLFFVLNIDGLAMWFWMPVLRSLDRYRYDKKNSREIYAFFLCGLLSLIPTIFLYVLGHMVADPLWATNTAANAFFYEFLMVGPVEEFSKFVVFVALAGGLRPIREPRDGMIQAATVMLPADRSLQAAT